MHHDPLQLLKTLHQPDRYLPLTNGLNLIPSFLNYFYSRAYDKLTALTFSLVRLNTIQRVRISDIEEFVKEDNYFGGLLKESEIAEVGSILRPLLELCVDLTVLCNSEDVEADCKRMVWVNFIGERDRILRNAKSFYGIVPKSLIIFRSNAADFLKKARQHIAAKSFRAKLVHAADKSTESERALLGTDYFNLYSFLSKKTHFELRNAITNTVDPSLYIQWCGALLLKAHRDLRRLLQLDDSSLGGIDEALVRMNPRDSQGPNIQPGALVRTEFGFARLESLSSPRPPYFIAEIRYLHSTFLGDAFRESVPALQIFKPDIPAIVKILGLPSDTTTLTDEDMMIGFSNPKLAEELYWVPFHGIYS